MNWTDLTGLILPIGSAILAAVTLAGIVWPGYVLGVAGTLALLVELATSVIIATVPKRGLYQIDPVMGAFEVFMFALTSGLLLFSGWGSVAMLYTIVAVWDAANITVGVD